MPPGVEVDHQLLARRFGSFGHREGFADARRERLLDEDMFARAQHGQRRLGVQMVWRRDRDRIDVARRELVETGRPGTPESLCERTRAAFVAIADEQNVAAGIGRERERVVVPTGLRR